MDKEYVKELIKEFLSIYDVIDAKTASHYIETAYFNGYCDGQEKK